MTHAKAFAKVNIGLVVGPIRGDGKHEIVTVLQRIDLHDDIALEPSAGISVEGFDGDTIVRRALEALADAAGVEPGWHVRIEKRIPVAAGLGGGSADAACALALANPGLAAPLGAEGLHRVASAVGADVPFFLRDGPQLATGDGTTLSAVMLPTDYVVLLVVPHGEEKSSTRAVYAAFDARAGDRGFEERAARLRASLESVSAPRDLSTLPPNDLVSSSIASALTQAGAFRADVTGAGPTVYALFEDVDAATTAAMAFREAGRTFLTRPVA